MNQKPHSKLHVPLTLNLLLRNRHNGLEWLLLSCHLYRAIELAVNHQHDAVAQFLRVGLRPTSIQPLEQIEFGLVVAGAFQDFHTYARSADRKLMALVDLVLILKWDAGNKIR